MNLKRWTEPTRPICPYALKSGDRACNLICVHCFKDGQNDKGETLFGCFMADATALNVWKLQRELVAKEERKGGQDGRKA